MYLSLNVCLNIDDELDRKEFDRFNKKRVNYAKEYVVNSYKKYVESKQKHDFCELNREAAMACIFYEYMASILYLIKLGKGNIVKQEYYIEVIGNTITYLGDMYVRMGIIKINKYLKNKFEKCLFLLEDYLDECEYKQYDSYCVLDNIKAIVLKCSLYDYDKNKKEIYYKTRKQKRNIRKSSKDFNQQQAILLKNEEYSINEISKRLQVTERYVRKLVYGK